MTVDDRHDSPPDGDVPTPPDGDVNTPPDGDVNTPPVGDLDGLLDAACAIVKADCSSSIETSAALDRVRVSIRLAAEDPCAPVRADLAALVAGELSPGRRLLVEDHAQDCLACHRLLKALKAGPATAVAPLSASRQPPAFGRWVAAAAVLAVIVGLAGAYLLRTGSVPADSALTLASLEGDLVTESGTVAHAKPGMRFAPGQAVRTARGARATFTLADGSVVEMNERTEIALSETRAGTTVQLARGDVIVEAAHRRERSLFVQTAECKVAVKGTIFTVGHGLKGSRVGVLEGEVHVDSGDGAVHVLHPGDQVATRASLTNQDLGDQVAWSRRIDTYQTLLHELVAVEATLAERMPPRQPRYSSTVLDALPADTLFYAALPNAGHLSTFTDVLRERLAASPALASRIAQHEADAQAAGEPSVLDLLDRMSAFSDSVGQEVVFAVVGTPNATDPADRPFPVLIAEVKDEPRLRGLITSEITSQVKRHGGHEPLVVTPAALAAMTAPAPADGLTLVLDGSHVVAGPGSNGLARIAQDLAAGNTGSLRGSSFHATLAEQYRRGAEVLIAVDLAKLVDGVSRQAAAAADSGHPDALVGLGLDRAKHFVFMAGKDNLGTAVLAFREERRGLASWLAAPAPLGSLAYLTPETTFVAAAAVKDPEAMLEDVKLMAGEARFSQGLADFEAETGIDIVRDLAGPLGGEIAIAVDGPLLPTPAWKVVLEVYETERLYSTVERLVAKANAKREQQADSGLPTLHARRITSGEGTLLAVGLPAPGPEVFVGEHDGFLVIAPRQSLVEGSFQARRLGVNLQSTPRFADLLPRDGQKDLSLVVYQDLGEALGGLTAALAAAGHAPDVALAVPPGGSASLFHARAAGDRITVGLEAPQGAAGSALSLVARYAILQALTAEPCAPAPGQPQAGADADSATEEPDAGLGYDEPAQEPEREAPRSRARRL